MIFDYISLVVTLSVAVSWFISADVMIACVLVEPVYSAHHAMWEWFNARPYYGFIGALMNITGIAVIVIAGE